MDMGNNLDVSLDMRSPQPDSGERAPDWSELRARFGAACAMRRTLGESRLGADAVADAASFDVGAARTVAVLQEGLAGVNRTDLGNRKPIGGNDPVIASPGNSGDRGL